MVDKIIEFLKNKYVIIALYLVFFFFSVVTLVAPCFEASFCYVLVNVFLLASLHVRLHK